MIDVFDRIHHDEGGRVEYHFILVDYLCWMKGGMLACGSDAQDARWVGRDDLAAYHLTPKTVAAIEKAFALDNNGDHRRTRGTRRTTFWLCEFCE